MKTQYDKELFEIYLESTRSGNDPVTSREDALPDSLSVCSISIESDAGDPVCIGNLIGTIRELAWEDSLICCLVLEKTEEESYLVFKASQFTRYAMPDDPKLTGWCGDYLVELDNSFRLTQREIDEAVYLDRVDAFSLMQLQHAWDGFRESPECWDIRVDSLDDWRSKFRIREHELTRHFRHRNLDGNRDLWVPQLDLLKPQRLASQLPLAAAIMPLSEAFELLNQKGARDIYYSLTHTLKMENGARVSLRPAPECLHKKGRVCFGTFCVFEGVLPAVLYFSSGGFRDLEALQKSLDIRIELAEEGEAH